MLDRKKRKKSMGELSVIIFGVYGKGNLGDEVLLAAIKEDVHDIFPHARILAFCSNASVVRDSHKIDSYSRSPFKEFCEKVREIRSASAFILGGGTLLYDQLTWKKDLLALSALIFWPIIARISKVPIIAYSQGIGPANHLLMRLGTKLFYPKLDAITIRDLGSLKRLKTYVRKSLNLYLTCDPVVSSRLFSSGQCIPNKIRSRYDKDPYIVVSLRHADVTKRQLAELFMPLAQCLIEFFSISYLKIILLPIQVSEKYHDDRPALGYLYELLKEGGVNVDFICRYEDICEAIFLLQNAKMVISNRLHALLLAARAGVPILAVSHHAKIRGCVEMIGACECSIIIDQDRFDTKLCLDSMLKLNRCGESGRAKLIQGVKAWSSLSKTNRNVLKSIICAEKSSAKTIEAGKS